MTFGLRAVNAQGAGSQGESSAFWHRIARIDDQIQHDLRELTGIDLDVATVFEAMKMAFDGNIFPEEAEERTLEIGDERVHLQHARIKRLSAAEGEKLPGQGGGAARGATDFGEMSSDVTLARELVEKEIAIAKNGGEEVVEVVRHAGGELAEGFHFLGAAKLIVQLPARRDVHQGANEPHRLPGFIAENAGPLQEKDVGSIGAAEPVFAAPVLACGKRVTNTGGDASAIFRMNVLLPKTDLARSGRRCVTEEALQTLRPREPAALYIPIPNRVIRSPGNKRRIFRAFSLCIFESMVRVRNFMGVSPVFAGSRFLCEETERGLVFILSFGC